MTKTPENDIIAGPQAIDVNDAADDGPLSDRTAAQLREICERTGEAFDNSLTEHQAQRRIAALQEAQDLH